MSYRDRLRPGSFRGVPFFTASSEAEGGRRGVVHEFPASDKPRTQDLGRAANRYTVEAFVIGTDYDAAKRKLIDALEKGGPGELVHRYFGTFQAEVEPGKTYRVVESADDGGMARFTIPFVRLSDLKPVVVKPDTSAKVKISASKAQLASINAANKKFTVSGPEALRRSVVGAMSTAISEVGAINDRVTGALGAVNQINSQIAQLGNQVATLVATPGRLIALAPGLFGLQDAIFGAIGAVAYGLNQTLTSLDSGARQAAREDAAKAARTLALAAKDSARIGSTVPPISTTAARGKQRSDNQLAVFRLARQAGVISAAKNVTSVAFENHSVALAMRETFLALTMLVAEDSDDDDAYTALTELGIATSEHLLSAAGALPRLRSVPVPSSLPAVVLAHMAHGDATRADEIVWRNGIKHPGFVLGGTTVQVLDA